MGYVCDITINFRHLIYNKVFNSPTFNFQVHGYLLNFRFIHNIDLTLVCCIEFNSKTAVDSKYRITNF